MERQVNRLKLVVHGKMSLAGHGDYLPFCGNILVTHAEETRFTYIFSQLDRGQDIVYTQLEGGRNQNFLPVDPPIPRQVESVEDTPSLFSCKHHIMDQV